MLIKSSRKMHKKLRHGLPVLPVLILAFLLASCVQEKHPADRDDERSACT